MSNIQWLEWGPEALDKARGEDKPILLDIGATWCHWCHVMERTTYADPDVAAMIAEQFVPVRVDTDARPDINARYNRGGWPTTAFLTPEGDLLGGGTFYPPAQMKQLLREYSRFYREHKGTIHHKIEEVRTVESERADEESRAAHHGVDPSVAASAAEDIINHADFRFGGLDRAPKFPHPEPIELALLQYHDHGDPRLSDFIRVTLDAMAAGGIHDHIGGGFHRYSVDSHWRVPHFEKLLDVNAGMLRAYAAAYRATGIEAYRGVAEGIMAYLEGVLAAPEGCFYSSQDADSGEGDDGSYYTWSIDEVRHALPAAEAEAVIAFFGMTPTGDIDGSSGRNVLHEALGYDQLAAELGTTLDRAQNLASEGMKKLARLRSLRAAPPVDVKIITNWNSQAARAYLEAYGAFGREGLLKQALRIVDFLIAHNVDPSGGAYHYLEAGAPHVHGLLCDQAALANACLDAYEASGRRAYLEQARELLAFTAAALASGTGAFTDAPEGSTRGEPGTKPLSIYDNAEAALALARLYMFTGDTVHQDAAADVLAALRPEFDSMGYLASAYAIAADFLVNYPLEFVIVGPADSEQTRRLHDAALRLYEPRRIVQLLDPVRDTDLLAGKGYAPPRRPSLFMCTNSTCAPPIHEPEQLAEAHARFSKDLRVPT